MLGGGVGSGVGLGVGLIVGLGVKCGVLLGLGAVGDGCRECVGLTVWVGVVSTGVGISSIPIICDWLFIAAGE